MFKLKELNYAIKQKSREHNYILTVFANVFIGDGEVGGDLVRRSIPGPFSVSFWGTLDAKLSSNVTVVLFLGIISVATVVLWPEVTPTTPV